MAGANTAMAHFKGLRGHVPHANAGVTTPRVSPASNPSKAGDHLWAVVLVEVLFRTYGLLLLAYAAVALTLFRRYKRSG